MKFIKVLILSLFLLLIVYPSDSYAQQCVNGGVECCVLDNDGRCGGSTFPGSCDSSCNPVCPGGELQGGNCSWTNPPPGGGGGGGSCVPNAVRVNCAINETRGTTIVASQCGGNTCSGPGSAQQTGACCGWVDPPRECGDWYPNPCGPRGSGLPRCQRDCTDEPAFCVRWSLDTYNCVATTPTCTVDVNPQTIASGTSALFPASIPASSGVITQVNFTSSNPAIATVTTPDTTPSYSTTASGLGAGTTTITASVVMSGSVRCTDSATLTVTNTTAWWQVRDGDVTAGNGNISSSVPAGQLFNTNGTGGFPGVFVYSGSLSAGAGAISTTNWNADTVTSQGRIFDYSYFENLIPDNIIPTTNLSLLTSSGFVGDGYEWFKFTGNTTINAINFANRKVILLIDNGNLTINGSINVTDGTGFFGAFVNGDINVSSTVTGVPSLEGVYLSDGTFSTGTGNLPLHVRGSVASYGGINLQRNLSNNSNPAELFEYAPDQILLFPKKLGYRRVKWAEIAP